ncbi:radical SAM protein [Thalassotalea sp. 1_MG-2023]|uniref:B12-binding domain-containing radical SAM protein n=1 Tax=Thalassotalea sp. 1_MG-2023 TaxID=3062680 RepID=UPI0026E32C4F|nr:radical SAM protein [Thalassotalea sp. 1_MG-2023]MDO6426455.1 radical SAM protein [Thalassotalea sp. 1_MG-2023]
MAKILFINPVVREEDVPRHIPYGIALLAAIAMKEGHLVQIYDANAHRLPLETIIEVCQADEWDAICIGGLTTTYNYIKKSCKLIKESAPNAQLIAGGGFLTSMPHEIFEWIPEIDVGCIGESFVTFPEVLKKIDNKDFNYSDVLGVIHRDLTGKSFLTNIRPNIKDLDTLPWPAWHLFPLDIYFANSSNLFSEESFTSKRRMDINGSFGCGLTCKYCWHLGTTGDMLVEENDNGENDVVFTYGRNIRYHSADYIVSMVKHLYEEYNIDFAAFIDENLMTMDVASKGTWLKELCKKWIEAGLQPTCRQQGIPHDENCKGVHWNGTSHAGLHRPETLKLMYEAGCTHLVYGLESFDPTVLRNLGKGSNARKNKQSIATCLASGIKPIPNIIIGFPEESFESVRNTIEALVELGITAKPHFATAYPGSEWYYAYKDSIMEQYDQDLEAYIMDLGDASKITATISHEFSPMQLLGLQQIVYLKDLRLLDLSEQHWAPVQEKLAPVIQPKMSFNLKTVKEAGPLAS